MTVSPITTAEALQALHTVTPASPNVPQSAVPDSGGSQSAVQAAQKAQDEAARTQPRSLDPNRGQTVDITA